MRKYYCTCSCLMTRATWYVHVCILLFYSERAVYLQFICRLLVLEVIVCHVLTCMINSFLWVLCIVRMAKIQVGWPSKNVIQEAFLTNFSHPRTCWGFLWLGQEVHFTQELSGHYWRIWHHQQLHPTITPKPLMCRGLFYYMYRSNPSKMLKSSKLHRRKTFHSTSS